MRKTSQDGGDNTSITSGIDNETKKPGAGILKSTRKSIKKKVQNFSNESDDTANEPLLIKNKEKTEVEKQSAKFLISKTKTDFASGKGDDRDKLLADDKITQPSISDVTVISQGTSIANGLKEQKFFNTKSVPTTSIHNHMNTNVFNDPEKANSSIIAKTQILVELDVSKSLGPRYSPSPLIFTTAKIHTDGKKQQMEPVQVTPVPILSTIEGGVVKTETKSSERKAGGIVTKNLQAMEGPKKSSINHPIKGKEVNSPSTQAAPLSKLHDQRNIIVTTNQNIAFIPSNESVQSTNSLVSKNKTRDSSTLQTIDSGTVSTTTTAKTSSSFKNLKNNASSGNSQVSSENKDDRGIGNKLTDCTSAKDSTKSSTYKPK